MLSFERLLGRTNSDAIMNATCLTVIDDPDDRYVGALRPEGLKHILAHSTEAVERDRTKRNVLQVGDHEKVILSC